MDVFANFWIATLIVVVCCAVFLAVYMGGLWVIGQLSGCIVNQTLGNGVLIVLGVLWTITAIAGMVCFIYSVST